MIDMHTLFLNCKKLDCFVRNWNVDMQLHSLSHINGTYLRSLTNNFMQYK